MLSMDETPHAAASPLSISSKTPEKKVKPPNTPMKIANITLLSIKFHSALLTSCTILFSASPA
ncbi:MAG: hypothetical protein QXI20_10770 [Candidatus Jordarchaeales archaeon]